MLSFLDFCTEENHDFVNIYDGTDSSKLPIASLSGCPPVLGSYTSSGQSMSVEFISDGAAVYKGFIALYEDVSRELYNVIEVSPV